MNIIIQIPIKIADSRVDDLIGSSILVVLTSKNWEINSTIIN